MSRWWGWLTGFLLLWPCWGNAHWLTDQQSIMGTEVSVTLWSEDTEQGRAAIETVMQDMRRLDQTLSTYIDTSDVSYLNRHAAEKAVPLSDELYLLIERSVHFSQLSGGAFDITYASVGYLYDYRAEQRPSAEDKTRLLPAVDYRLLQLDSKARTLRYGHDNLRIDLGGIAKGYAVDRAIDLLRARGIDHAAVSAGGDSRVLGDKRGQPWVVGIKNPRQNPADPREVVISLPLQDSAISTSGDYQRYFVDADSGERVHHILNPSTGRPADELVSVTVLGPRSLDADALSTTLFVLGAKRGLELVEKMPDYDVVIIDRTGQVHYSAGLMPPEAAAQP